MKGNAFAQIATIYNANITLNTACIPLFENIKWCVIGVDEDAKQVAIKVVTDEEFAKHIYPPEILNKVSLGKSYVRISNKSAVKEISKIVNKKCDGEKFLMDQDKKTNDLIIDLTHNLT